MDRRSFVKTAVGVAAAGTVGASTVAMTVPLAIPRAPPAPEVPYYGFHKVAGPAPRGVPLIPIFVNDRGEFEGRPVIQDVPSGAMLNEGSPEINVLDWYKYCGHQDAPGLSPDWGEDSVLRYFIAEDKIRLGFNPWFADRIGQPMRPEHFTQPGLGASFVWRSQGQSGVNVLTGVLMRWRRDEYDLAPERPVPPARALRGEADEQFLFDRFIANEEFIAASTFCTHFCCIPGFREAERLAASRGAEDALFCTCHFTIYDPREIVSYRFSPDVTGGDGDAEGGAH